MKTLIAVLIAMGGGAGVAVAAVAGVSAAVDPDNSLEQAGQQVDVLDYGTR